MVFPVITDSCDSIIFNFQTAEFEYGINGSHLRCSCYFHSPFEIEDHTSHNEDIKAGLYTKEEVKKLMETEEFSSRSQIAAYFFVQGFKPQ